MLQAAATLPNNNVAQPLPPAPVKKQTPKVAKKSLKADDNNIQDAQARHSQHQTKISTSSGQKISRVINKSLHKFFNIQFIFLIELTLRAKWNDMIS